MTEETPRGFRFKFKYIRFVVQLLSLLLVNGLFLVWLFPQVTLNPLPIGLPILASINASTTTIAGSLDWLQVTLARPEVPWITLGIVFAVGAVLGRWFCGWICPMGFIQDMISGFHETLHMISPRTHAWAKRTKYLVLAGTLLVSGTLALTLFLGVGSEYKSALGPYANGIYLALSPETTLFGTVPRLILSIRDNFQQFFATPVTFDRVWNLITGIPTLLALQLFVLAVFFYGAYRIPRFWCRYLCPMGAAMAPFQKTSYLGISRDPVKCSKCPHCEIACPMQIKILDLPWEKFNDPECILCMECVDSCPHKSLKPKFP
jgi:polyferredoxin